MSIIYPVSTNKKCVGTGMQYACMCAICMYLLAYAAQPTVLVFADYSNLKLP